jgi:hypothetical protein
MRFSFLLIVSLFLGNCLYAQTINLSDSLRQVLRHKPMPTAKFDTRNSFITGKSAKVFGIKVGVSFRKTLTIGIGYNWIGTKFTEPLKIGDDLYESEIKLRYVAPFLEYSFYKKGPWEATVPVQIGFGKSFLRYSSTSGKENIHEGHVVLYEPGMAIEYKLFDVVGVGAGMGYRIMLKNNKSIEQQFTSPVYVLRIRLIFDELFKKYKKFSEVETPSDHEQ